MSGPCLFEENRDELDEIELNTKIYEFLGVHREGNCYVFRTYQPNAVEVELAGDFNSWSGWRMNNIGGGIWELRRESEISLDGNCYKYRIYNEENCFLIPDPFARYAQWGNHDASIVYTDKYEWGDEEWMAARSKKASSPVNIYQLHLGSWKNQVGRHYSDGAPYLNYLDLAAELVGYISDMGYTHICIVDITEKGKNVSFAPTSRHGRPEGLKHLIDTLHRNNIGVMFESECVILDQTVSDEMEMRLAVSSALYWICEFHADGIYLSGACDSRILETLRQECESAIIITESGNSSDDNTLTLDKKWSENVLDYAESDPQYKRFKYPRLNRGLTESFGKNRILAITYAELSQGKSSLLSKMRGDYAERFARLRLFFCYMMTHPGKKLLFMGCEFGENTEWRRDESLQWFLLEQESHKMLKTFVKKLNFMYRECPAMWENDFSWRGFKWIQPLEEQNGILAFERISSSGDVVIAALNFTDNREREVTINYAFEQMEIVLNSDSREFGGKGRGRIKKAKEQAVIVVPPLSAVVVKKGKNIRNF